MMIGVQVLYIISDAGIRYALARVGTSFPAAFGLPSSCFERGAPVVMLSIRIRIRLQAGSELIRGVGTYWNVQFEFNRVLARYLQSNEPAWCTRNVRTLAYQFGSVVSAVTVFRVSPPLLTPSLRAHLVSFRAT